MYKHRFHHESCYILQIKDIYDIMEDIRSTFFLQVHNYMSFFHIIVYEINMFILWHFIFNICFDLDDTFVAVFLILFKLGLICFCEHD
jgi:hypothetical protein